MSAKSMRDQFAETMLELGQEDNNLVVLVGDISHFILQPFAKACPGRYYNVGICEPTIISMAAGLAKMGFVPVAHTIAPFLIERSFEQIKLDFGYHQLGGNLITVGSAFDYSNLGCTHHCYSDFALLKTLPGSQIVYPASPVEFDILFRQVYANGQLTLYRLPAYQHEQVLDSKDIEFGKGVKVIEGEDVTIVATGPHLKAALGAREQLTAHSIDAEVIYLHTIRPLDDNLILSSASKTRRVIVIEEHAQSGGVGEEIARLLHTVGPIQFSSVCIPDEFQREYGTYHDHCERLGFSPEGINNQIQREFNFKA
ncbi:MAG: transketolase C-terminal domain-containing protein [Candidatus Hinthialibacter antarcticus]|nr:transketolase C-terminal domain-containing protein [Candidatus Hinthialibacter antarcticus]